ncbi:ABC transporter six-transmembrane domain-containing protein [Maricaulis sp.]|uniref:ABC transporter six-transmembrane domain-containing protein n=1 Tax=Maricaulis sp. TaxID=1486257 RepID=UPI002605E115|nr:ABC transporter six-transmembrane domain-containing protein [Maricaulis sp.]
MSDTTTPESQITHARIFQRFRLKISGTFALLTVENVLGVLEPALFGIAINGLINGDWTGLAWLAALEISFVIIGVVRRMYDTRVYTRIYAEVGSEVVAREQRKDAPITQVNARAELISEVVGFFEDALPLAVMSVFTLVGSVIMIGVYDIRVFFAALGATLGTGLIFFLASQRIETLNKALNNQYERQIQVFESQRRSSRERHFSRLAMWKVRLSDFEALNFGLTYILLIAVMLYGIFDAVTRLNADIGTVVAMMTYLFQFVMSMTALPLTYQQYIRTREITNRVSDKDEDDGPDNKKPDE